MEGRASAKLKLPQRLDYVSSQKAEEPLSPVHENLSIKCPGKFLREVITVLVQKPPVAHPTETDGQSEAIKTAPDSPVPLAQTVTASGNQPEKFSRRIC
jgi:hypothetical protein